MTGLAAKFLTENTHDYWNAKLVTTIESSTAPLKVKKRKQKYFLHLWKNSFKTLYLIDFRKLNGQV